VSLELSRPCIFSGRPAHEWRGQKGSGGAGGWEGGRQRARRGTKRGPVVDTRSLSRHRCGRATADAVSWFLATSWVLALSGAICWIIDQPDSIPNSASRRACPASPHGAPRSRAAGSLGPEPGGKEGRWDGWHSTSRRDAFHAWEWLTRRVSSMHPRGTQERAQGDCPSKCKRVAGQPSVAWP